MWGPSRRRPRRLQMGPRSRLPRASTPEVRARPAASHGEHPDIGAGSSLLGGAATPHPTKAGALWRADGPETGGCNGAPAQADDRADEAANGANINGECFRAGAVTDFATAGHGPQRPHRLWLRQSPVRMRAGKPCGASGVAVAPTCPPLPVEAVGLRPSRAPSPMRTASPCPLAGRSYRLCVDMDGTEPAKPMGDSLPRYYITGARPPPPSVALAFVPVRMSAQAPPLPPLVTVTHAL